MTTCNLAERFKNGGHDDDMADTSNGTIDTNNYALSYPIHPVVQEAGRPARRDEARAGPRQKVSTDQLTV